MNPLTFQMIVLRYIALSIKARMIGNWSREEAAQLLDAVERLILRYGQAEGIQERTLPAGIETKHGQAALDVEED